MNDELASTWDVPRPSVRLGVTFALGLLGPLLMPVRAEFFPNPFANIQGASAVVWMTAALAGVALVHRLENAKFFWGIYALMGLGWGLSLMLLLGFGPGWFGFLCFLLVAGASILRVRLRDGWNYRSIKSLLRGPAIVLVAPLLLFASRPSGGRGSFSPAPAISRVAFAIFPYALAAGFPLTLFYYDLMSLARLAFGGWIWLGCGLLFVLSPWPHYHCLPPFGDLPKARKISPVGTAILLAMALVPVASLTLGRNGPFPHIISGQLFTRHFNRIHVGGALDQPTIGKWLFLFTLFSVLTFLYVATTRWMSDRSTRLGYWVFAVPTIFLCLCLLSILTVPFCWLLQYINAMGLTPRRIYGVAYGLAGYLAVLGFLCWALKGPKVSGE